jgi:hypothetical protein
MQNWKQLRLLIIALPLAACSSPDAGSEATAAPPTPAPGAATAAEVSGGAAQVYIVSPEENAEVQSPVTVQFGADGFDVAPAGTYEPRTGHHHLLVNTPLPALDQPVPADENHIHFGAGQTETTLELPPGEHTLQLLLGDGNHQPHNPPLYSAVVNITVVE